MSSEHGLVVRRAVATDLQPALNLVAALPDYFSADSTDQVRAAFNGGSVLVACDDDRVVGLLTIAPSFPGTAEFTVAAVEPSAQRVGIGRALVRQALSDLLADEVRLVLVKTLDESCDYVPYVATRAFWRSMGFLRIAVIDPMPGWQPGNPAALMVRAT